MSPSAAFGVERCYSTRRKSAFDTLNVTWQLVSVSKHKRGEATVERGVSGWRIFDYLSTCVKTCISHVVTVTFTH